MNKHQDDKYDAALEREVLKSAAKNGLEDETASKLKYQLYWCLQKNDWYFTGAGIILGGVMSWMSGSMKPFFASAVLSPAADWAYSRAACAEYEQAYKEHKAALHAEMKQHMESMKDDLRKARGL